MPVGVAARREPTPVGFRACASLGVGAVGGNLSFAGHCSPSAPGSAKSPDQTTVSARFFRRPDTWMSCSDSEGPQADFALLQKTRKLLRKDWHLAAIGALLVYREHALPGDQPRRASIEAGPRHCGGHRRFRA